MKEIEADVVIVGSGLVGLVAAHCLSSLKFNVALVDKKDFADSNIDFKDTRTVAISEGSKQFLHKLSLWNGIKKHAEPIKMIKVFDRNPSNKIFFENDQTDKCLGYVVQNQKFSKILRDKIYKNKSINLYYGSEVNKISTNKDFAKIFLNNEIIKTKLIIAADGKNSFIRKLVGNQVYKKTYSESALVINFFHEKPLNNTAYEIFYKTGPLAILPMKKYSKYFQSSIIWSNKNNFVQRLFSCNNKFITSVIEERVDKITGKILNINSVQYFPLSAHINDKFFNKRLIYIGDAAHSIHPIAGQGWNLGVKDIRNINTICEKLDLKKSNIGNINFCKSYNDLSYKNAFQLYQVTDKLNSHFKKGGILYRSISNSGFKIIEKNKLLKNEITKYAMGI